MIQWIVTSAMEYGCIFLNERSDEFILRERWQVLFSLMIHVALS